MTVKNRAVYKMGFATAIAAAYAGSGSAFAAPDTVATFTSGTQLDNASSWSINAIPAKVNDALLGTTYPASSFPTGSPTLSSNQSFGTLDDLMPSSQSYLNIYGPQGSFNNGTSTVNYNTQTYILTLGAGGSTGGNLNNSNSVTGASPNDLIYAAPGSEIDFRLGGTNTLYGIVAINLGTSGNFDAVGTGIIYDNNKILGTGTITKTGTGSLFLESTGSTFTGGINLSAGVLSVGGGGAFGTVTAGTPNLTFTGNSTLQVTATTGFGATRIIQIPTGVTATIDSDNESFAWGGPFIGGGNLVKINTGIMTFSGTNSFTGSTNVAGGTIVYNQSCGIANAPLTLSGGGSILLDPGYNFNVSFPSVTLGPNPGQSSISAASFNSSTAGLSVSLAALSTRPVGLTLDFLLPSNGTITTTNTNTDFTATGGQLSIIGGWATANSGSTWAVSNASGAAAGAIVPLTNYDTTFNITGADVDVVASATPTISSVNTLRFSNGAGATVTLSGTLVIASGGILDTAANGTAFDTITGGSLTSGNGTDLIINQFDNNGGILFLASTISDYSANTSTGLTKSGAGAIYLQGTNTFSGPTNLNAGKLFLQSDLGLQNSTYNITPGTLGTLEFDSSDDNYVLGGLACSVVGYSLSVLDYGGTPISSLTIGGNNQSTVFNGILTESLASPATGVELIKVGTGTTYLADGNSNFSGSVMVNGGLLEFISGASFGLAGNLVTINNNAGVWYNASGASVFGVNRTFALGGGNDTIEVGPLTGTANASTNSLLTIGTPNNASSGILSGPGTLVKTGIGTLTLSGSNTYTGGTNVSGGLLVINSNASLPAASNLSISALAELQAANVSAGIFALSLNSLSNSGLLDLTRNAAVIHTGPSIANVFAQVASGFNSGAWNGATGITSSTAAADASHLTAVGVILNDTTANTTGNVSGQSIYASLDGAASVDGDILVKTTYYGDANLTGVVDGSDYSLIDNGYLEGLTGWYNGDFNYDGVVDGSDYTLIDNAYNSQGAALTSEVATPTGEIAGASATSAVPEPASLGILTLTATGLLGTRRRRK